MSLLERLRAQRCRFVDCTRERHPDMPVCRDDLGDYLAGRYVERPDGLLLHRRLFPARELSRWAA